MSRSSETEAGDYWHVDLPNQQQARSSAWSSRAEGMYTIATGSGRKFVNVPFFCMVNGFYRGRTRYTIASRSVLYEGTCFALQDFEVDSQKTDVLVVRLDVNQPQGCLS